MPDNGPTIEEQEAGEEQRITISEIMPFSEYTKLGEEAIENGNEEGIGIYAFEAYGKGEYEGKRLTYYGSEHLNDPEHEMFSDIETRFNNANPDVVFVEGYPNLNWDNKEEVEALRNLTREEAILGYGENFFTAKLAADRGIRVESPEPEFKDEVGYLLDTGFSKDHVFAYYFYKQIPYYLRTHSVEDRSAEDFKEFMEPQLERFRESINWEGFDYSYEHAVEIGRAIWNEDLDIENFNERKVDPALSDEFEDERTGINDIAAQSSMFRDVHIANKIAEAMKNHNSVFIVYGSAHAVMQEPALRKVIEGEQND